MTKTEAPATKKDIEDLVGVIHGFMQHVDERFNAMDKRFDKNDMRIDMLEFKMNAQFEETNKRFERIEATLEHLTNTVDQLIGFYKDNELENAARDRQFDRLLEWARKVSIKTGIPLENL